MTTMVFALFKRKSDQVSFIACTSLGVRRIVSSRYSLVSLNKSACSRRHAQALLNPYKEHDLDYVGFCAYVRFLRSFDWCRFR